MRQWVANWKLISYLSLSLCLLPIASLEIDSTTNIRCFCLTKTRIYYAIRQKYIFDKQSKFIWMREWMFVIEDIQDNR